LSDAKLQSVLSSLSQFGQEAGFIGVQPSTVR